MLLSAHIALCRMNNYRLLGQFCLMIIILLKEECSVGFDDLHHSLMRTLFIVWSPFYLYFYKEPDVGNQRIRLPSLIEL